MAFLTVDNASCLRGSRLVFEGVDFSLDPGGAMLLTGPNGSGKSSLIRLLAGLIDLFDGSITLNGQALAGDRALYQAHLAYIGHLDPVKPTLTVRETLDFWAAMLCQTGDPSARVSAAMEALTLSELADAPGAILSSGQRRRLSLARLLVSDAEIWLMDEPTVGLDTVSVAAVEALVADHRDRGGMVVLSTHIEFKLPGAQTLDLGDFRPAAFREEAGIGADLGAGAG